MRRRTCKRKRVAGYIWERKGFEYIFSKYKLARSKALKDASFFELEEALLGEKVNLDQNAMFWVALGRMTCLQNILNQGGRLIEPYSLHKIGVLTADDLLKLDRSTDDN